MERRKEVGAVGQALPPANDLRYPRQRRQAGGGDLSILSAGDTADTDGAEKLAIYHYG